MLWHRLLWITHRSVGSLSTAESIQSCLCAVEALPLPLFLDLYNLKPCYSSHSLRSSMFVAKGLWPECNCATKSDVTLNSDGRFQNIPIRIWFQNHTRKYLEQILLFPFCCMSSCLSVILFFFATGSTWVANFSPPINSKLQLWPLAAEPFILRVSVWMMDFVILISGCTFVCVTTTWKSSGAVSSRCHLGVTWFGCRAFRVVSDESSVMIYKKKKKITWSYLSLTCETNDLNKDVYVLRLCFAHIL